MVEPVTPVVGEGSSSAAPSSSSAAPAEMALIVTMLREGISDLSDVEVALHGIAEGVLLDVWFTDVVVVPC